MWAMVVAKQSPPNAPIWQTTVVILAAIAVLAMLVYAANKVSKR